MRELKYYIACSVDGFIAHKDGSFDGFLMSGEHIAGLADTFPETFPAHFRDNPQHAKMGERIFDRLLEDGKSK